MERPEILQIKEFIASGSIDSALKVLLSMKIDSILENEVRTLSASYNNATKDYNLGTISNEEKVKVYGKAIQGILNISDKISNYSDKNNTHINTHSTLTDSLEKADECYQISKESIGEGYSERDILKYLYYANRYYKIAIEKDPNNPFLYFRLANTLKTIYLSPEYKDKDNSLYSEICQAVNTGKAKDRNKIFTMEFNQIINDLHRYDSIKKRPFWLIVSILIISLGAYVNDKIQPIPDWISVVVGIPIAVFIFNSMNLLMEKKEQIIISMRRG